VKVYAETADVSGESGEFTRRLHGTLSECAEENRLLTPRNPEEGSQILDAAYLVPRADSGEFLERVNGSVGEEPGMRVELTGPWAAYSFTGSTGLTGFAGLTGCTG
jgi:hypothetical protein